LRPNLIDEKNLKRVKLKKFKFHKLLKKTNCNKKQEQKMKEEQIDELPWNFGGLDAKINKEKERKKKVINVKS